MAGLYDEPIRLVPSPAVELTGPSPWQCLTDRAPAWHSSTNSPRSDASPTITCCPRPAPTYCAASAAYRDAVAVAFTDTERRYRNQRLAELTP
jgi:hypothetical protein